MKKLVLLLTLLFSLSAGSALAVGLDLTQFNMADSGHFNTLTGLFDDGNGFAGQVVFNTTGSRFSINTNPGVTALYTYLGTSGQAASMTFSSPVDLSNIALSIVGANAQIQITYADSNVRTFAGFNASHVNYAPSDMSIFQNVTSIAVIMGSNGGYAAIHLNGLNFDQAIAPLSTPVPAAALLLGSGLAGLVALRRRKA